MAAKMSAAKRYTALGGEDVECRIHKDQVEVSIALAQSNISAFIDGAVMIGGYARGEGGFVQTADGPEAYNDYDYFVILHDFAKPELEIIRDELSILAKQLEGKVGVEVDFFPLLNRDVAKLPYTLMYSEMQAGHRIIFGREDLLSTMPKMPLASVPKIEFVRMMLNRGTLLLFNAESQLEGSVNSDVYNKYINKAVLACGDTILARAGRYHLSYKVKRERLQDLLGDQNSLVPLYNRAVDQKFEPVTQGLEVSDLRQLQTEVIQIWLSEFEAARQWAAEGESLLVSILNAAKNLLINARTFGIKKTLGQPTSALLYPRERLYRALPKMLSDMESPRALAQLLHNSTEERGSLVASYTQLWYRYS